MLKAKVFRVVTLAIAACGAHSLFGASACTSVAPNLVTNCGFESGNFTGWTLSGFDSAPGFNGIDYGVDAADAHTGSYGAYLGGFGGILDLNQQIITTPGSSYSISFWLAQAPTPSSPYVNSFSATFGSVSLLSLSQVPGIAFTQYTFTGLASAPTTTLTFGSRDDLGFFSIDDVTVTAATAVPEPSTLWLGTLMLAFVIGFAWPHYFQIRLAALFPTAVS